jgi:hypothetical protein
MTEDDTHDRLVKEYLEYFRTNEMFQQRPSELKRREVRKHLSQIMKLSKLRRSEIMNEHIRHVQDGRKNNLTPKAKAARQKREEEAKKSDT